MKEIRVLELSLCHANRHNWDWDLGSLEKISHDRVI